MADIEQQFVIRASPQRVFEGVSRPALLDQWWTLRSSGEASVGSSYDLDFGPEHRWRAVVTRSVPGEQFELRMTESDPDWESTLVGFALTPSVSGTQVRFYHRNWPVANEHFRISAHCWALYLRLLRRHLEQGEAVPYDRRLDA